jgi:hypothetical protein
VEVGCNVYKMKKKLPLSIIKNFQPKENESIYLIRPEEGDGFLLHFSDVDTESEFYFRIIRFDEKNNKFLIEHVPTNSNSNAKSSAWFGVGDLNNRFDSWLKIISEFNETETIFDDPILKGFQDEYYSEFEILDKDASTTPLKSKQIMLLDEHLSEIEKRIDKFETDDNRESIIDIKAEISELKSELTKKPKKWIVQKLSLIWGKITKQGTELMKEFLTEGKKQAIKQGIRLIIESGENLLN